jgi:hypothetical protein
MNMAQIEIPNRIKLVLTSMFAGKTEFDDLDLQDLADLFDKEGPYPFCKKFGLLVDNSAEDFAMEFMSFYTTHICPRY